MNLRNISKKLRKNILILTHQAKSSHIGSCLSIVDILTVLYLNIIKKKNNDRFILSKGHATLALYCVLHHKNIINKKTLFSYGKENSLLMGHTSHHVPGIIFSTGSLGHGLPVAAGIALSSKIRSSSQRVYVLLSDGELNEGSNWEALMFSSHQNLDNLCVIIDYNKLQSLTTVSNTINIEPLKRKFQSFGCDVEVIDGHNFTQIKKALKKKQKNKPKIVIANTTKGKGVSFMENKVAWHYRSPNANELQKALIEIENA